MTVKEILYNILIEFDKEKVRFTKTQKFFMGELFH